MFTLILTGSSSGGDQKEFIALVASEIVGHSETDIAQEIRKNFNRKIGVQPGHKNLFRWSQPKRLKRAVFYSIIA
jgi:hypothetical protein